MEPVALSPIKRRGTAAPPALKDSASAPSFSNHFKARIDQAGDDPMGDLGAGANGDAGAGGRKSRKKNFPD